MKVTEKLLYLGINLYIDVKLFVISRVLIPWGGWGIARPIEKHFAFSLFFIGSHFSPVE